MRSYQQFCGVAKALDLVGERWTLLIIRNLIPGGQRYSDLLSGLPGITTNLLAKRLKHLQARDILRRRVLPPPAGSTLYELTPLGRELEPVVLALGAWGAHFMSRPQAGEGVDVRWAMVSIRRRFKGSPTPRVLVLQVEGGAPYTARFGPDGVRVEDGEHPEPDARIIAPFAAFGAWLLGSDPESLRPHTTGNVEALEELSRAISPNNEELHRVKS